ncbi:MAG: methyltransferase domain-containing protein, partial [Deltaproteobacteria bacterium]|nr:methyltransferase domain-containing protein [Deltaproteobacteria bacterium]
MENFYADPGEEKRWGEDMAALGLYPTEEALLSRHVPVGARVLNIGCGGGREALAMARTGRIVTALDLNAVFVDSLARRAAEAGLDIECRVMDALALDVPPASFDAVVMVGQLIGHIRGRRNRIAALRKAFEAVRPYGVGIFSTNAIEAHWLYRVYFLWANAARKIYNPMDLEPNDAFVFRIGGRRRAPFASGDAPVFHWYRVSEFRADLRDAGWAPKNWLRRGEFER